MQTRNILVYMPDDQLERGALIISKTLLNEPAHKKKSKKTCSKNLQMVFEYKDEKGIVFDL